VFVEKNVVAGWLDMESSDSLSGSMCRYRCPSVIGGRLKLSVAPSSVHDFDSLLCPVKPSYGNNIELCDSSSAAPVNRGDKSY
jgi:hypothetical protein